MKFLCILFLSTLTYLSATSLDVGGYGEDMVTYQQYGAVNLEHTAHLPNIVNNLEQHYVINNLIINGTERLMNFACLFSRNPAVAITEPSYVRLHHIRPFNLSNPTADSRDVTYIQSIDLFGIQSGTYYTLSAEQQILLTSGDLIALSSPNNAIFFHIGPNDQGLEIPYASIGLPIGTNDDHYNGTFHINTDGSNSQNVMQLCTQYGTVDGEIELSQAWRSFNRYVWPPVVIGSGGKQAGKLKSISIIFHPTFKCLPITGTNNFLPGLTDNVNVYLSVLKWDSVNSKYKRDMTRNGILVTGVSSGDPTFMDLQGINLQLNAGEILGFYTPNACVGWEKKQVPAQHRYLEIGTSLIIQTEYNVTTQFEFEIDSTPLAANIRGDPQFAGFQGQSFQFHGLADEIFNLLSSSQLQMNGHFVYLSSGKCDYNNTLCFQHPGTYVDELGITIPSSTGTDIHIHLIAGPHEHGLRVYLGKSGTNNEHELMMNAYPQGFIWKMDDEGAKASIMYTTVGEVTIRTPLFEIKVTNSDFFFNLGVSLLDQQMLRIGRRAHTITDRAICDHNAHGHAHVEEPKHGHVHGQEQDIHATHDHGLVEAELLKKYKVDYALHGLIGQTWRNVRVCGKDWVGSVEDYLVSSIFGDDYFYNFYKN